MKSSYSILLLLIVLISCNFKKEYQYIEIFEVKDAYGKTSLKREMHTAFKAPGDSAAYLIAYERFCILQKTFETLEDMESGVHPKPLRFELFREKSDDITNTVQFATKTESEKKIRDRIFSLYPFGEKNKVIKKISKEDSLKIKSLEQYFITTVENVEGRDIKTYRPLDGRGDKKESSFYFYFPVENGVPGKMKFRLQYCAIDRNMMFKVNFTTGDKEYDYQPGEIKYSDDATNGRSCEWFDENLQNRGNGMMMALAGARKAKLEIKGRLFNAEKMVKEDEILAVKRTLELYQLLGGDITVEQGQTPLLTPPGN